MKSVSTIMAMLTAVALLGSIGATTSLQQNQASAQGVIVDYKEQFDKLSEQFKQDVLGLVSGDPPSEADPPSENRAVDPPDPDKLAALFDNYEKETFRIFGLEPPDPDAPSAGDPPTEADPPTEVDPPDPDVDADPDLGR